MFSSRLVQSQVESVVKKFAKTDGSGIRFASEVLSYTPVLTEGPGRQQEALLVATPTHFIAIRNREVIVAWPYPVISYVDCGSDYAGVLTVHTSSRWVSFRSKGFQARDSFDQFRRILFGAFRSLPAVDDSNNSGIVFVPGDEYLHAKLLAPSNSSLGDPSSAAVVNRINDGLTRRLDKLGGTSLPADEAPTHDQVRILERLTQSGPDFRCTSAIAVAWLGGWGDKTHLLGITRDDELLIATVPPFNRVMQNSRVMDLGLGTQPALLMSVPLESDRGAAEFLEMKDGRGAVVVTWTNAKQSGVFSVFELNDSAYTIVGVRPEDRARVRDSLLRLRPSTVVQSESD